MSNIIEETTKSIVGISIETTNTDAAETIPALWGKFFGDNVSNTITSKISDDVYAVYTDFENAGVNNEGVYKFLIGVEVSDADKIAEGLDMTRIPEGHYHRFNVPENNAEQVFPTWMSIWSNDGLGKTFQCDFEQYNSSGAISINIGTSQRD